MNALRISNKRAAYIAELEPGRGALLLEAALALGERTGVKFDDDYWTLMEAARDARRHVREASP